MHNLCNDLQAEKVTGSLLSGPALLNPQYIALYWYRQPCWHKFHAVCKLLLCENEAFFQLSFKSSELVLLLYIIVCFKHVFFQDFRMFTKSWFAVLIFGNIVAGAYGYMKSRRDKAFEYEG